MSHHIKSDFQLYTSKSIFFDFIDFAYKLNKTKKKTTTTKQKQKTEIQKQKTKQTNKRTDKQTKPFT